MDPKFSKDQNILIIFAIVFLGGYIKKTFFKRFLSAKFLLFENKIQKPTNHKT